MAMASTSRNQGQQRSRYTHSKRSVRIPASRGSSPSTPSSKMTPSLWSRLPQPILERVLAWLPISDFMRYRVVCRRWNSLPLLQSFLSICSAIPFRGLPWYILFNSTDGLTYDTSLKKWFHILLPSAEGVLRFPVASNGGLILYYTSRYHTLSVGNPLQPKLSYDVPRMPFTQNLESAGLIVTDPENSAYKVVVMGTQKGAHNVLENITEVFDSTTQEWTFCGVTPPECLPSNPNVVCCKSLYSWCDPDNMVRFNMKKKVWRHLETVFPRDLEKETLVGHQLLQSEGRIYLVGSCEDDFQRKGVRIWFLKVGKRLKWLKYDEMPPELFVQFIGNGVSDVLCLGCEDACLLATHGGAMILTYDLKMRRWEQVPEFRTPTFVLNEGFIDGIPYWPRLDVQACKESHVIHD